MDNLTKELAQLKISYPSLEGLLSEKISNIELPDSQIIALELKQEAADKILEGLSNMLAANANKELYTIRQDGTVSISPTSNEATLLAYNKLSNSVAEDSRVFLTEIGKDIVDLVKKNLQEEGHDLSQLKIPDKEGNIRQLGSRTVQTLRNSMQ